MSFRIKKLIVNILFVAGTILDLCISFFINKVSQEEFNLLSTSNIITGIVLSVLITAYIVIQVVLKKDVAKNPKKKLQKAFQDNGGYEVVVDEIKSCIEKHDYKSIKELKKIVEYIEKWGDCVRVCISKAFSNAIVNLPEGDLKIFNEKIDLLKNMSQKDIIESKDIFKLIDEKDLVVYAYNLQESTYLLFTFKEKSKIVLVDKIELIGDDELKSLVYSDVIAPEKKEDCDD